MYQHNYIPTCYFPSTVMFIDDSRDFLINFTLQLDDNMVFRIFDSPNSALDAVHSAHQQAQFNERYLTEYAEAKNSPGFGHTLNIDLSALHYEVYNPQRFGEISVIVVDYDMPGMTGLDFCRKMENSPIKRILLTGRADERVAVRAFNDGIINVYLQKQDPNLVSKINESIAKLQMSYFQNMSEIIVKMLSVKSPLCVNDPEFIKLFNRICKENNIIEYYITENSGSFLLLDSFGNYSYLIIKSQQEMDLHYELALCNQAPEQILTHLRSGEKVPFFWQKDNMYQPQWDDWSTFLYPAQKFVGNNTYYYAFVKNPIFSDIQKDKIVSFNTFLERTYAE